MTTPRNVLIVLTDQLRADCLGCTGNPDVATPHLDALAATGTTFEQACCVAPICTPSRYTLLTGVHPRSHGVFWNNQTLSASVPTLPERAATAGVRSAAIGKMHLQPTYLDVGFQTMLLSEQDGDGRLSDDYHRELREAGLIDGHDLVDQRRELREHANQSYWSSFGAARSDLPQEWHSTSWVGEQAVRYIDRRWAEGGQLLYVSFIKPHHPFDPPAPWDTRYDPDRLGLLPGWTPQVPAGDPSKAYFDNSSLDEAALRRVMAMYYGTISHLDEQVGRILARLQEVGGYDNTLVLFTSDHGEYLGFHHLLLKSGPMYEPLVRVPLLVKDAAPGQGGRVDQRLASGVDVVPTALAALGLAHDDLPGVDLLDPGWTRPVVVAESASEGLMVRSATHKLLVGRGEERLHDLVADPWEESPLPPVGPVGAGLREELEAFLARTPVPVDGDAAPRGVLGPERVEQDPADFPAQLAGHPWLRAER